jgi:hypothetical protein
MSFPVHDWQFWATTGLFILAAAWLLRGLLPGSKRRRQRRSARRAMLTVGGKPVSK